MAEDYKKILIAVLFRNGSTRKYSKPEPREDIPIQQYPSGYSCWLLAHRTNGIIPEATDPDSCNGCNTMDAMR